MKGADYQPAETICVPRPIRSHAGCGGAAPASARPAARRRLRLRHRHRGRAQGRAQAGRARPGRDFAAINKPIVARGDPLTDIDVVLSSIQHYTPAGHPSSLAQRRPTWSDGSDPADHETGGGAAQRAV